MDALMSEGWVGICRFQFSQIFFWTCSPNGCSQIVIGRCCVAFHLLDCDPDRNGNAILVTCDVVTSCPGRPKHEVFTQRKCCPSRVFLLSLLLAPLNILFSIPCWQFFLFIKLHRIIKLRPCVPLLNKLCQILQMCKVQLRRPEAGVILLASLKQCTHKNFISSKLNLKSSVMKEDIQLVSKVFTDLVKATIIMHIVVVEQCKFYLNLNQRRYL